MQRKRIFFMGVGGQGTLTATILLARAAMMQGYDVSAGEVHGMAQRGGVVESTLLIGGWKSPRISPGEADILLGFEPLETLRGLSYLANGGVAVSSVDPIPPIAVSMGKGSYPDIDMIKDKVAACAGKSYFLPAQDLGRKAGAVQSGNVALLGTLCAAGAMPFGPEALYEAITAHMKTKLVDVNIKAVELGVEAAAAS